MHGLPGLPCGAATVRHNEVLLYLHRRHVFCHRRHPILRDQHRHAGGGVDPSSQPHGLRAEGLPTQLRPHRRRAAVEGEAEGPDGPAAEEPVAHVARLQRRRQRRAPCEHRKSKPTATTTATTNGAMATAIQTATAQKTRGIGVAEPGGRATVVVVVFGRTTAGATRTTTATTIHRAENAATMYSRLLSRDRRIDENGTGNRCRRTTGSR